jgi:hypothetical protein
MRALCWKRMPECWERRWLRPEDNLDLQVVIAVGRLCRCPKSSRASQGRWTSPKTRGFTATSFGILSKLPGSYSKTEKSLYANICVRSQNQMPRTEYCIFTTREIREVAWKEICWRKLSSVRQLSRDIDQLFSKQCRPNHLKGTVARDFLASVFFYGSSLYGPQATIPAVGYCGDSKILFEDSKTNGKIW